MERNLRFSKEAFQRLSQKSVPVFLVICLPYLLSATIVGSEALALNQVQGDPWKGVIRWSRKHRINQIRVAVPMIIVVRFEGVKISLPLL